MGGVEKLNEDVRDADLRQYPPEGFGAEVQEPVGAKSIQFHTARGFSTGRPRRVNATPLLATARHVGNSKVVRDPSWNEDEGPCWVGELPAIKEDDVLAFQDVKGGVAVNVHWRSEVRAIVGFSRDNAAPVSPLA